MCFPGFKRKALTFSYDDDVIFNKRLIEIFNKNGLKATFKLNSGYFSTVDEDWGISQDTMVGLLKNSNHEIAVHGEHHLSMNEFDSATIVNDIIQDRKNFKKLLGKIVKGMAYSNGMGAMNDYSVEILKACGIKYARTTESTHDFNVPTDWLRLPATCHHSDSRLMELAKTFVGTNEVENRWASRPLLFYIWGQAYEFAAQNNWEIIEEFAKYVSRRNDVWYATNGEIYDYVQAYNRLEYSVDGKIITNPSAIDVYIMYPYIFDNVIIKAGQTVVIE